MSITTTELEKWEEYLVGKQCPKHPQNTVKKSKFGGVWCGVKEFNGWCRCGFPTQEWLDQHRKENND